MKHRDLAAPVEDAAPQVGGDTDVAHLVCDWCSPQPPFRAMCGAALRGEDQGDLYDGLVCWLCDELRSTHLRVLHPGF